MVCAGWRADLLGLTVSSQADAARRPSSAPRRGWAARPRYGNRQWRVPGGRGGGFAATA